MLALGLIWPITVATISILVLLLVWSPLAALLDLGDAAATGRTPALLLLVGLLVDGISLPWRGILEGTQRYPVLAAVNGGTALLGAGLTIAAAMSGGGLVELACCSLAASVLRAVLLVGITRVLVPALSPSLAGARREDIRAAARYGLPVQVTTATGAVNLELDRFVLAGFFGAAVAGGFELGGRLVNLFRLLPALALLTLFPMAVTQTERRGPAWLRNFNLQITRYLTMFAATGAAAMVVCADPLVRAWLGGPNAWAAANVAILAPAYAFNLAAGGTAIATRVEGRPGRETSYALLSIGPQPRADLAAAPAAGPTGRADRHGHRRYRRHLPVPRPLPQVDRTAAGADGPGSRRAAGAAGVAAVAGWWLSPQLPDGLGRGGALLAIACRGSVVLLVAVVVLLALGSITAQDRERARTPAPPARPSHCGGFER